MLDLDQLSAYFDAFTRSAWRLENHDTYTTPHEAGRLARYLDGADDEPPGDAGWNRQMAARVAAGCQWRKIHVLRDPTAAYFRYAAEWSWPNSARYGQDIRILDLVGKPQPGDIPDADYWVIDDETVILMHYTSGGQWTGAELVPPPDRARYLAAKHAAYRDSVPFASWWRAHPEHHRAAWLPTRP